MGREEGGGFRMGNTGITVAPGPLFEGNPVGEGTTRRGSPADLPDPGIEPRSPAFQADALTSEPPGNPTERQFIF